MRPSNRTILFLSFFGLIIGLKTHAQEFQKNSKGQFEIRENILTNGRSSAESFELSETWFINYFKKKEEGKIHSQDASAMWMEASPLIFIEIQHQGNKSFAGVVSYTIRIECSDEELQVLMYDFVHESHRSTFGSGGQLENEEAECGSEELPDLVWKDIQKQTYVYCQNLLENLSTSFAE